MPKHQSRHYSAACRTGFAVLAAMLICPLTGASASAAEPQGQLRQKLAERVCEDGSTTIVSWNGELIVVEFYSAPRPDGTVSGYDDAYDRKDAAEAKAHFDALACPEG